jgi:aryl-alcohol dehydrogenase-like predicted oxidoreductase
MRLRRLGREGPEVSVVGLGCNNFGRAVDLEGTRAVVDAALDAGVTLLDTADVYGDKGGSESFLGEVLEGRRDNVVLATKFGSKLGDGRLGADWDARNSRRYIRRAVESSLTRLRTDWIDLYQLHFPDGKTPMEETLATLHDLVQEGKVRYIGSSNLDSWQIADADWVARTNGWSRFVSAQNHYSLLEREVEKSVVPACQRFDIGLLPYFPLANGLLTGKYHRGEAAPEGSRLASLPDRLKQESFDAIEALEKYAAERGRTLLDVAIGGLAAKPAVASVIAGATKPEQVRANAAGGTWKPTAQDMWDLAVVLSS